MFDKIIEMYIQSLILVPFYMLLDNDWSDYGKLFAKYHTGQQNQS